MPAADRPWFLWDTDVSEAEFRSRLKHPDPLIRAQWQAALLREARVREVWQFLTLDDVLDSWLNIRVQLGRRRAFWEWALDGWRRDGLLPG